MDEDEREDYLPGQDDDSEDRELEEEEFDASEEAEEEPIENLSEPPTAETPAVEQAPSSFRPTLPQGNPHLDNLSASLGPEVTGELFAAVRYEMQRNTLAQTYAGGYIGQVQQVAPTYFQEHAAEIAAAAAQTDPQYQGTPLGAGFAAIAPFLNDVERTGDVGGALARLAKKLGVPAPTGATQTPAAPVKPAVQRTLTPAERVPSPGSGGGGGTAILPRQSTRLNSGTTRMARDLMDLYPGLSEDQAKTFAQRRK